MRNLKRALSMLLSSTMVLGMVAMGGSAAGYQDVDGTNNQEAIEVLQAVGIMTGDENGNFNPDGIVTRNEMAVIMSNLMAYNVATYKGTSPFTDVPEWAEPYVAACYTNGITAGISDTLYGGDQTVTTSQAALMIMKALGYFQYQSDFGSDWQLSSITQGNKIDLFDKVNSGVKDPMTRNDVAQLVLNGLKSGTVMAETSGSITVGDTTIVSGVKYNYVTSEQDYAYTISTKRSTTDYTDATASIVELGEKLYQGDLTLNSYMENLNTDVFGRPANTWEYQAKEIGTYSQDADVSFDDTVTYKEMYDAVGNTATSYTWFVTVDGEKLWDWNAVTGEPENFKYAGRFISENKTNDNDCFLNSALVAVNGTGNGVRTNVYVDGTKKAVYVSVTHYYAAEVYEVNDGSITLSNLHDYEGYEVADTDDVYETSGSYAEDDIVMYSFADDKIQEVYAATSVEGNVERVRVNPDDEDGDYYDIDGTRYKYNTTVDGDARLQPENVNNSMVGYLDQYGYTAYIDESAVSYDYAYVLSMGSDDDLYGGGASTIYARLVLTDGSVVKVETNVKASSADADYNNNGKKDIADAITTFENHIVSYTVDQNGVYTLVNRDLVEDGKMQGTTGTDAAPSKDELFIENGVAAFKAGLDAAGKVMSWTANSNTVFIVAESDNQSIEDYDYYVYTGVKNVPDIEGIAGAKVCVAADKNGVAKVVYIQDADVSGAGQVIFARADSGAKLVRDTKIGDFREIAAVVDGEVVTLNVKTGTEAENKLTVTMVANGIGQRLTDEQRIVALESVTYNADGLVTNVRAYDPLNDGDGWKTYNGTGKHTKETVILGGDASTGEAFAYYEDIDVARYDTESKSFKVSTVTSVKTDYNDSALGVFSSGVLNGLCIIERPLGELPEIEVEAGDVTVVVDRSEMPAVEDVQNATIDEDTNTLTFEVPVNVSNAVAKARAASEEYKYTLVWKGTLTYTDGDVTKSKTMEGTAEVEDGVATISIKLPETYDSAVFTLTSATLTKELVDGGENPPAAEDEATISYNKDETRYTVTGDGNFKVANGATVTVKANEGYVITNVAADNAAAKVTNADGVYTITVDANAVEAGTKIVIDIKAEADDGEVVVPTGLKQEPYSIDGTAPNFNIYYAALTNGSATSVAGLDKTKLLTAVQSKDSTVASVRVVGDNVKAFGADGKEITTNTYSLKGVYSITFDNTVIGWAQATDTVAANVGAANADKNLAIVGKVNNTKYTVSKTGAVSVSVTTTEDIVLAEAYEIVVSSPLDGSSVKLGSAAVAATGNWITDGSKLLVTSKATSDKNGEYRQLTIDGKAYREEVKVNLTGSATLVYPELTVSSALVGTDGKITIGEQEPADTVALTVSNGTSTETVTATETTTPGEYSFTTKLDLDANKKYVAVTDEAAWSDNAIELTAGTVTATTTTYTFTYAGLTTGNAVTLVPAVGVTMSSNMSTNGTDEAILDYTAAYGAIPTYDGTGEVSTDLSSTMYFAEGTTITFWSEKINALTGSYLGYKANPTDAWSKTGSAFAAAGTEVAVKLGTDIKGNEITFSVVNDFATANTFAETKLVSLASADDYTLSWTARGVNTPVVLDKDSDKAPVGATVAVAAADTGMNYYVKTSGSGDVYVSDKGTFTVASDTEIQSGKYYKLVLGEVADATVDGMTMSVTDVFVTETDLTNTGVTVTLSADAQETTNTKANFTVVGATNASTADQVVSFNSSGDFDGTATLKVSDITDRDISVTCTLSA